MPIFAAACLFLGAVLGCRFKVYVLVPTGLLLAGASLVAQTEHGASIWLAIVQTGILMACLQVGYVVGLGLTALPRLWPRAALVDPGVESSR